MPEIHSPTVTVDENLLLSYPLSMLVESYRRKLLAENKSPRTIQTYGEALRLFEEFLTAKGMPTAISSITREHVESFITDLLERFKPATASNRYRALKVFFAWAAEEGEIRASPMERIKPPTVPEDPPEVLTDAELKRLLKTCKGQEFEDRRDNAILRLFVDTGMRLSEIAGLQVEDLDFDLNVAGVIGKGRRPRACPFGRRLNARN